MTAGRVVFVVSRWRAPTETFVWREVEAAMRAGHEVVVLSLKVPAEVHHSDPPVVHLAPLHAAMRATAASIRRPRVSCGVIASVVRSAHPRNLAAHLYAAAVGLAAGPMIGTASVFHAHFAWVAATAALAAARSTGSPFSVMTHAFDIFDDRRVDRLTATKLRAASLVGVESDRIAAHVRARFGCEPVVVRMGVPPDYLVPAAPNRTGLLVASIGSLLPKKGHDVLLRALLPIDLPWTLTILGEGSERSRLVSIAHEHGVEDRVQLPGHLPLDEVRGLLDRAAVFCLASRVLPSGDSDGVPNVLIEAMARGVPVVATSVGGIPDLLGDDRGLVVDPEDEAALTVALRQVLEDPQGAARRAERALAHVRSDYTTDANWRRLAERLALG